MGLFRRGARPGTLRQATDSDVAHLQAFVRTRRGVEAYQEPRTTVTETTLLLVAHDGEWTRRRIPGPGAAGDFARREGIPLYDAAVVGYPQRMREYNARRRQDPGASPEAPGPTPRGPDG